MRLFAVFTLLLTASSVLADEFAWVHDRSVNRQYLAMMSDDGSLSEAPGALGSCCQVSGALVTLNASDSEVYAVGATLGQLPDTLYTFDALDGSLDNSSTLPADQKVAMLAYDNSNGRLLAIARDTSANTMQLFQVAPASAAFTPVGAAVASCCTVRSGVGALDTTNNRISIVAWAEGENSWQLLTFNSVTGVLTSSPVLAVVPDTLSYQTNGTLIGIYHHSAANAEMLASFNVGNGGVSDLGLGRMSCCTLGAGVAVISGNLLLTVARDIGATQDTLFGVSLSTGEFTSLQLLDADQTVNGMFGGNRQLPDGVLFADGFEGFGPFRSG